VTTRLRCGERTFEPAVRVRGDVVEVTVGDRTFALSVTTVGPGVFLVREGERSFVLHAVRDGASSSSLVHAFWDGVAYTLAEEREGARAPHRPEGGGLEAPMPGRVAVVHVAPGQRVARGQELLVVEAMKMENALRAPRDGVVRAVHVSPGDMVAPGRPLLEMEP
jgi:3-methylcrotonyl-CoA carboxylase alpha subunit